MSEKRIALLLGQAEEQYQADFIRGVEKQAFRNGYDVCIFSMYIKYQNSAEREFGDSNIYNLINYDLFDAVIVLSDTIQTPGVEKKIEQQIHESFKGPVICIDVDSPFFSDFWTDGYVSVYSTISHLIEEHNLKDIAYLTGRRKHVHSQRRLEAYMDSMKAHGLTVREDRVFYGDFWYTSGIGCAEALLRNEENLPQAVVCANDCMAIGFAEEMESHGKKIPDDIVVCGYGITEEGRNAPKVLTSTYIPAEYYGEYAAETVLKMIKGEKTSEPDPKPELFIGESCGCHPENFTAETFKRTTWRTKESEEGYYSNHNFMVEDMLKANSLDDLFRTVYENIYFLHGVDRLDICLNDTWLSQNDVAENAFPTVGYSDRMVNVLSYVADNPAASHVGTDLVFNTKELLPYINPDHEPKSYIFNPLFFEDKTFGYAMISYGNEHRPYEEVNRLWLSTIARCLESYRRLEAVKYIEKQSIAKLPLIHSGAFDSHKTMDITNDEMKEIEEVEKILNENLLTYHFQPIVNSVDGEIFSYEALMRSNSQWKIPPLQILKHADILGRLSDVEKATFINVLNIVGEHPEIFTEKKVFINSIPGSKLEYEDFVTIEKLLKKNSGIAVIELTEQAEFTDEDIEEIKHQYRRYGIGLAVDDYGTGYSNVSNLLRYMPDYVKIDRSLISDIQDNSQKQHFVSEVINFCHANNIKALAEGVETAEELRTVIRLGTDLIQGYYVARPAAEIIDSVDSNVKMEIARYHREREDGSSESIYKAGQTNRISINNLIKENKTTIVLGEKDMTFRDVTIVGTPNQDTKIHIEVLEGYDGSVTLENVNLSNIKRRPCIRMAENCKLSISLEGDNRLKGGGIKVPESSRLTIEGDGNLRIIQSGSDNYAIGNTMEKRHGLLEFFQDGEIYIEANGQNNVGIGSGLGGHTRIVKGKYVIKMSGDEGVGIGSLRGEDPLRIHDTDIYIECRFYKGICIGNLETNTKVDIWRSLVRCNGGGKRFAVIGTVDGEKADIRLNDLSVYMDVRSDYSTGLGSLSGTTNLDFGTAAFRYRGTGTNALVYGGMNDTSNIKLDNIDIEIELESDTGKLTNAKEENYKETRVNSQLKINE